MNDLEAPLPLSSETVDVPPTMNPTLPDGTRFGTRLLGLVFLLSGMASLIYQVVWQRLLTLHYGVGPVSVTIIVTVYMLGLGFGALLGGFLARTVRRRLTLYLWIEVGLGAFGFISAELLTFIGQITAGSDHSVAILYMFLFLCFPTILMGITLPILVQVFSGLVHDFQRGVSFLYFINTLGAAFGAVVASYGLISFGGLDVALRFAAGVNFLLAALIYTAARKLRNHGDGRNSETARSSEGSAVTQRESLGRLALAAVFVTGFIALAYEIIWMRIVGVMIKDSPYAFSTVLAVYLVGIALGSYGMDRLLRKYPQLSRRDLFFTMQAGIALYVLATIITFSPLTLHTPFGKLVRRSFNSDMHPRLPDFAQGLSVENQTAIWSCIDVFFWPVVLVLVPTILMGGTFPLLALLSGKAAGREGTVVGDLYFWNIMGNVAGGLATGFFLLPWLGTERAVLALAAVGLFFLFPARTILGRSLTPLARGVIVVVICGLGAALAPKGGELYRAIHDPPSREHQAYFSEGVEGVVLTYVKDQHVRNFIGGQAHGGRPGHAYYYETIEALSYASNPRKILVIGYGTGSMVEMALRTPGVESVTLVELNGTLMRNLSGIPLFQELLKDPRLNTILEDGRRYLLRSRENYDAILIDPLRSSTAYSGNLYSQEFFSLARDHLTPNGVFLLWLDEHQILPATVAHVFPHARIYSFFAVASKGPLSNSNESLRDSALAGFTSHDQQEIMSYANAYRYDETAVRAKAGSTKLNRDLRPSVEYYLGRKIKALFSAAAP